MNERFNDVSYRNPETMTVKEFRAFIEVANLSEVAVLDLLMRNR